MKRFGVASCYYLLIMVVFVWKVKFAYSCTCYDKSSVLLMKEDCVCSVSNSCLPRWDTWASSSGNADDTSVDVAFFPFVNDLRSAINVTFTLKNTQIKGLAFRVPKNCFPDALPMDRCRFYDFRNATDLPIHTLFYNNEMWFENEFVNKFCVVSVMGLSRHTTVVYNSEFLVKIPDHDKLTKVTQLREWKSFVVLEISDKRRSARVSFTTAPPKFNVSTYKWRLVADGVAQSWKEIEYRGGPVIYEKLADIYPNVDYEVEVSAIDGVISKSARFKLTTVDLTWLWILCGLLINVVIISVIVVLRMRRPIKTLTDVKVFLVYSHDIKEHVDVVQRLAEYLKTYCYCSVLLDIWHIQNEDPHFWVSECIKSADFILIIWSKGAQLKVQRGNTKVLKNEPGYLGEDLFSNAMTKISAKISRELKMPHHRRNLRRFINISLSYVPKDCVPSELDYLPHYRLPSEFNALLCCLHAVGPAPLSFSPLPSRSCTLCFQCYPSLPFSRLKDFPEGELLLMAVAKMQKVEKKGDWLKEQLEEVEPPILQDEAVTVMLTESAVEEDEVNGVHTSSSSIPDELEVSDFPPDVQHLPIFGADDSQILHHYWPPVEPFSTNAVVNNPRHQSTDSHQNYINDNFNISPVDALHTGLPDEIFGPHQSHAELPDEIFGPVLGFCTEHEIAHT